MTDFDPNLVTYIKWAELQAEPNSKSYYYNKEDKVTQWVKPTEYVMWYNEVCNKYLKSIASSWRQYTDKKGKVYYANKATSVTAWSVPAELEHFAEFRKFVLKINSKNQVQTSAGDASPAAADRSGAVTKKRKLDEEDASEQPVNKTMKMEEAQRAAAVIVEKPITVADTTSAATEVGISKSMEKSSEVAVSASGMDIDDAQELAVAREVRKGAAEMDLEEVGAYLSDTADAVLDAGVVSYIERCLQLSDAESVRDSGLAATLGAGYMGSATLCKVVSQWSGLLQSFSQPGGDATTCQNEVLFRFISGIVKERFRCEVADRTLDRSAPVPGWLEAMLCSEKYRRLLLELFVSDSARDEFELLRPSSQLLEHCVGLMLTRGHVGEVCSELVVEEVRSVPLRRELVHAIMLEQIMQPVPAAAGALSLRKLVAADGACFVYAMELVSRLIESYVGDDGSAAEAVLPTVTRLHRLHETIASVAHMSDWKLSDGDDAGLALASINSTNRAKALGTSSLTWWLQPRRHTVPEGATKLLTLVRALAKEQSVSDVQAADLHASARLLEGGSGDAETQTLIVECLHLEPVASAVVRRFMRHGDSGSSSTTDSAARQLGFVLSVAHSSPSAHLVLLGATPTFSRAEVEEFLWTARAQCHALVDLVSTSMGTVHHVTTAIAAKLHAKTQELLEGRLEVSVVANCVLEWIAAGAQATSDKKQFSIGCFHALLPAHLSLILGVFGASTPLLQLECVSLLQLILSPGLAAELTASVSLPHQSEDLVRHCLATLVHMLGISGRQLGGGDSFVIERVFALVRAKLVQFEPEMVRYFFQHFMTNLQPPFADSYQHNLCQLLLLPQTHSALSKTLSMSQSTRNALLFVEQFRDVVQWLQFSLKEGGNSATATAELQAVLSKYGKLVSLH